MSGVSGRRRSEGNELRPESPAPAYLVEDALHEDHADANVLCHVRQEFDDQVIDWIGAVSNRDAGDGGRAVTVDAGNIEVAELRGYRGGEQGSVVGHGGAVIALRDYGMGNGMEGPARDARVRHATVARVLVREGRDQECAEEFAGRVLEKAVSSVSAEALPARAVGGVRVDSDGDGGGACDGNQVEGVLDVIEGEMGLLLRRERYGNADVEKSRIRVGEADAWLTCLGRGR